MMRERSGSTTRAKRDWLRKMGELVEEGEWINKSVLSASLGPAQSFKRVDVGSSVSTFFSLLFSSLLFLLLSFSAVHMADSTSASPPSKMASLQHTNACSRTLRNPQAASYLRFDYVRSPCGAIAVFLVFASCPDVGIIIRWNPGLPTRVTTTWSEHLCRGSRNAAAAFWLRWCGRRQKNRAWGARRSSLERLTAKSWKKIHRHV